MEVKINVLKDYTKLDEHDYVDNDENDIINMSNSY